jgi:hypothetical protein
MSCLHRTNIHLIFKRPPCSYCFVSDKNGHIKVVHPLKIYQYIKVPRWLVQVLHPPQKFERPPFWNDLRYGITRYGVEVIFNSINSLLNFLKIYQLVQKLLGGTHRRTDRWSHKPHFPSKEGRQKITQPYVSTSWQRVFYLTERMKA